MQLLGLVFRLSEGLWGREKWREALRRSCEHGQMGCLSTCTFAFKAKRSGVKQELTGGEEACGGGDSGGGDDALCGSTASQACSSTHTYAESFIS